MQTTKINNGKHVQNTHTISSITMLTPAIQYLIINLYCVHIQSSVKKKNKKNQTVESNRRHTNTLTYVYAPTTTKIRNRNRNKNKNKSNQLCTQTHTHTRTQQHAINWTQPQAQIELELILILILSKMSFEYFNYSSIKSFLFFKHFWKPLFSTTRHCTFSFFLILFNSFDTEPHHKIIKCAVLLKHL